VRRIASWVVPALALSSLTAGGLAGCSSAHANAAGAEVSCGNTRTGAGVPVTIKIVKGSVSCSEAISVEDAYAQMFRRGEVKGNGGGAPVQVDGWTCQSFDTPEVLKTGNASQCHTATAELLAVLPVSAPPDGPSASATS
jgi:hypothetical protein